MVKICGSFKLSIYAIIIVVLNLLDLITTIFFLQDNNAEGGPVMAFYYQQGGYIGLSLAKFGILALSLFLLECLHVYYRHKRSGLIYSFAILIFILAYFGGIAYFQFFDII